MRRSPLTIFLFVLSFVFSNQSTFGQIDTNQVATDSIVNEEPKKVINSDFLLGSNADHADHDPRKAAIYSTILPGLGQAYNKKYWKIGLLYALEGLCIYQIVNSHREYKQYRNELFLRDIKISTNNALQWTSSNEELDGLAYGTISTRKDLFRDRRDKYFLYASLLYAVNIIDAVVDAHLIGFNPNKKNKRLNISPALIPNQTSTSVGLNLKFRF